MPQGELTNKYITDLINNGNLVSDGSLAGKNVTLGVDPSDNTLGNNGDYFWTDPSLYFKANGVWVVSGTTGTFKLA